MLEVRHLAVVYALMVTAMRTRFKELKLATITPDAEQPRKVFTAEGLAELSRSMAAEGLLQPITVKLAPTYSDRFPAYVLISGERRFRSAIQLGWETIPAMIKDGIGEAEAAKMQLLENIVRQDLNPVEQARRFQRLLDEGMTKHELASSVGKPVGFVTMAVEMLSVRLDVLRLVESGTIPPLTAFQMSKLSHDRQGQVLRAMATQTISFQDVSRLCQRLEGDQAQPDMFPDVPERAAEARRVAKTFESAFGKVAQMLNRIEALEEKREAWCHGGGYRSHRVGANRCSNTGCLNRVKRLARDAQVARLLEC